MESWTEIALRIALAIIMFTLGMGLTLADFGRVVQRPRDLLVGAFSQVVLLPLIGLLIVTIWPVRLEPALALGVMIIAAAPGGVTSNLLTAFARGDVALSISLTAVISLLCVVTVPFIVVFSHDQLIPELSNDQIVTIQDVTSVSVFRTAIGVFLMVTVPLSLGVLARRLAGNFVRRRQRTARTVSVILFVLVVALAIFENREHLAAYFAQAGLIALVLNVVMMVLAHLLARLFASGRSQRIAISIECGLQNSVLAIAVAGLVTNASEAEMPAATYSLIMFVTALIYIGIIRHTVRPRCQKSLHCNS